MDERTQDSVQPDHEPTTVYTGAIFPSTSPYMHPDIASTPDQGQPWSAPPPFSNRREWSKFGVLLACILFSFFVGTIVGGRPVGHAQGHALVIPATPISHVDSVLATWNSTDALGACTTCAAISFSTNGGPLSIVVSGNPYQYYAGSPPGVTLQIFDSNGHLVDSIEKTIGDVNVNAIARVPIPESLPAGSYTVNVEEYLTFPMTIVVLGV